MLATYAICAGYLASWGGRGCLFARATRSSLSIFPSTTSALFSVTPTLFTAGSALFSAISTYFSARTSRAPESSCEFLHLVDQVFVGLGHGAIRHKSNLRNIKASTFRFKSLQQIKFEGKFGNDAKDWGKKSNLLTKIWGTINNLEDLNHFTFLKHHRNSTVVVLRGLRRPCSL